MRRGCIGLYPLTAGAVKIHSSLSQRPGCISMPHRTCFYLRLGLAVFLFFMLFRMVDLHKMGGALASIQPPFIVAGFLIMLLNYGLKTYRWASILWIQRPDISFRHIARFNFLSIFLGNFLPSSLSADVVRIYYVSRRAADPRAAISSIFADRVVGNFSLAIATIAAFLALKQTGLFAVGSLVSYSIVAFLVLAVAAPLAFTSAALLDRLRSLLDRFAGRVLFESVQDIAEHLRLYWNRSGLIAKAIAIAFLNLAIAAFEFYLIARGLSAPVPIEYFFLFIPLVIFLATLPVSVGGLGVVEASLVFFFSRVGMPLETCLAMALVFRALQLTFLLPGAFIYLADGFSAKELSASRRSMFDAPS